MCIASTRLRSCNCNPSLSESDGGEMVVTTCFTLFCLTAVVELEEEQAELADEEHMEDPKEGEGGAKKEEENEGEMEEKDRGR